MKIAHDGRRETFPLGTPNKASAAARARDIYLSLVANGWDATLAKFKKLSAAARALNVEQPCTIGEFLEAIARTTTNQSTVEDYARAFRQIVSDIFGLSNNKRKYDYQSGGRAELVVEGSCDQLGRSNACESTGMETVVFGQGWFGCYCIADGADIPERHHETGAQLVFAQEAATHGVDVAKAVALRRSGVRSAAVDEVPLRN